MYAHNRLGGYICKFYLVKRSITPASSSSLSWRDLAICHQRADNRLYVDHGPHHRKVRANLLLGCTGHTTTCVGNKATLQQQTQH